jgi:hypothetical protein
MPPLSLSVGILLGLINVLCVDVRWPIQCKSDMWILAQEWFAYRFNYAEFSYMHNCTYCTTFWMRHTYNGKDSTNVVMYTDEYT